MRYIFIFLFSFFLVDANAQEKVALVLSGGAAKGIAHVGVLKALEEHNIPIDYIAGTSMGGIIGGCYAAGMSPAEIEKLVLSDEFLRWVNGFSEEGYNYFYHQSDDTPQFLKLNLAVDSTFSFQFNTSIANDASLNFAFAEKMYKASAISNGNFDNLFVPFRVVASDIFTQSAVVLSKGSMADALRATQTVPFFYTPIRIDGKYLFDGGVYNNFPVNVAQKDFNPDVIIGVNVSAKVYEEYPFDTDDKIISKSLLYLLLDKSDPSQIPANGVFIQPNLKGFTSFDFSRAQSLLDSGYVQTIRQIEEIKSKISSRSSPEELTAKRAAFFDKNVPDTFDKIVFSGFNKRQRGYIRRYFKVNEGRGEQLNLQVIKDGYFRLVSESYFANTYPGIRYDSTRRMFDFHLARRPQQNFKVDFGGVIATRDISNLYLGLSYYRFGRMLTHYYAGFQTGSFYKSALLKARIDFPLPFYLEPYTAYSSWDFLQGDDLLKNVATATNPTVLRRINRKYALDVGLPLRKSYKTVFNIEGFSTVDRYVNGNIFISTDTLDEHRLNGFKAGLRITSNTLNRKQYASSGKAFYFSAFYFNTNEDYRPGNTSVKAGEIKAHHQWFRVKATSEQFFGSSWYRPGYYAEAVFSNQPFFQNYYGTIINAPSFFPIQDSRALILQNFRSFNYLAIGSKNVFELRNKLDFRLEGYLFKPFDYVVETVNQEASIRNSITQVFFAGTAGFVFHSAIGPVSLSMNYYDDPENRFGVLLHIGFLLFNNHSLE